MDGFFTTEFLGVSGYQIIVIIHVLGVAIGAGAAFFSDFLFTNILKDRKISAEEYRILKLNSSVVWLGLAILIASGILIVSSNSEFFLNSEKFLAKATIVGLLTVNGIIFHLSHLPMVGRNLNSDLRKSKEFRAKSLPFFISGAFSGVSWTAAIVLGSIRGVDLSYLQILGIYAVVVALAAVASVKLQQHYLGK